MLVSGVGAHDEAIARASRSDPKEKLLVARAPWLLSVVIGKFQRATGSVTIALARSI